MPEATTPETKPDAPAIPDKFKASDGTLDTAKVLTSYAELEKKLASSPVAPPTPAPAAPAVDGLAIKALPPVDPSKLFNMATAVKQAGLTPEAIVASWKANGGKLTEPEYVALERAGVSREQVNSDVAGQEARYNLRVSAEATVKAEVDTLLGGATQHETIRTWAAANIPAARLEGYAKMIEADPTGRVYVDIAQIVAAEYARSTSTDGSKPLVAGQQSVANNKPATTRAEYQQLTRAWEAGDANAKARLLATPRSVIESWAKIEPGAKKK